MLKVKREKVVFIVNKIIKTSYCGGISPNMNKFKLPKSYEGNDKKMWIEYIQLALDYKPLDLGHGFPDFAPPSYITGALQAVAAGNSAHSHQYKPGFGHPRLLSVLAKLYSALIGRDINPQNEILIGYGAFEALYACIAGHVDIGDEVIIIEPFFDCYVPMVKIAGGVPRFIPLRPNKISGQISSSDWILDPVELENIFNEKTKMIIINTPNNPMGKVFTMEELEIIANLCKKWNVLCISDEVYEWMVYKPNKHIRIATLPGMWQRTITIGSAGKAFGVTGWKIGWAYGPANLIRNLQIIHQHCVYSCTTPLQEAVAIGFEKELSRLDENDCYFVSMTNDLQRKRDFMAEFLTNVGMTPVIPEGGYFMIADWSPLASMVDLTTENDQHKDFRFTKWMTKHVGLQGIPPTAFYSEANKHLTENFVRYCFIKKDENLKKAADILQEWKERKVC